VLGVPTLVYLPYCFFNIASPVLSVLYGVTGFKIEKVPPIDEAAARVDPPDDVITPD
jgi:NhaC family Na+:H+ antiporter